MPSTLQTLRAHVDLETDHPDPDFKGPFAQDFEWPLAIGDDGSVDASAFPELRVSHQASDGTVVTVKVLRQAGGSGQFGRASGNLSIAITLRVSKIVYSDVVLALSTQGTVTMGGSSISGEPVGADGRTVLVGEGPLHGIIAPVEGKTCKVKVSGVIAPAAP